MERGFVDLLLPAVRVRDAARPEVRDVLRPRAVVVPRRDELRDVPVDWVPARRPLDFRADFAEALREEVPAERPRAVPVLLRDEVDRAVLERELDAAVRRPRLLDVDRDWPRPWWRLARLSPRARAWAVSRPMILLKLLFSPPAVVSW